VIEPHHSAAPRDRRKKEGGQLAEKGEEDLQIKPRP